MKNRNITIKDIAKLAGVSHSTVSRSLNDSPLISDSTKERVKKIAADMDFEFNSSARSLSTSKTGTIGIIYPETYDTFGNTLYLGLLIRAIRGELESAGLDSLGTFPVNHFTGESHIKKLISRKKVDGFLILHSEVSAEDWEYIDKMEVPSVILHFLPRNRDISALNCFFNDNEEGGFIATDHLVKSGCRNILSLTEAEPGQEFGERTRGYKRALESHGLPFKEEDLLKGVCSYEFGYSSIMSLEKERLGQITGVFAQADLIALGVVEGLRERGIKIPEKIRVVGYDDTELGKYLRPRLTTVHQPREELARNACSRLIDILNGDNSGVVRKVLRPELIIRET